METFISKQKILHTINKKNSIVVKYEDSNGKARDCSFNIDWYFAIKRNDSDKANILLKNQNFSFKIEYDEKFPNYAKIYTKDSITYKKHDLVLFLEQNGIQTYEGDLNNDKRWYVDNQVQIGSKYRKLYIDIETDDSIRRIQIGRDRILSWAAIDDSGKIYFDSIKDNTDKAEELMLCRFLLMMKNYDIILGWNIKEFDIPYLKERMKKYNLHKTNLYCWNGVAKFDLLKRFRHIFRFDSNIKKFSLEYVSQHFLGRGKIPHTESIHILYEKNKELLKKYNIEDCILVKELDEKLGVSNMMILQSQWCGVPPAQFGLYSIIDSFIMRTAHNIGKFCPTSIKAIEERNRDNERGNENPNDTKTKKSKYIGAAVIDPSIGLYEKVYTFDFKGLYPSMMRTSNIGFDSISYSDDGVSIINPGTSHIIRKSGELKPTYFYQDLSVINLAITQLIQKRKEYKELKLKMIENGENHGTKWESVVSDEIIVKELANSTYGIMGLEYGRYYSVDVAESITLFGQWVLDFAKKFFEFRKYKVIYGDTDSIFVATNTELDRDKELKLFHKNLKKELKEKYRINECFIELNPDKIYKKFILLAKKNYAGHVIEIEGKKVNELYARGLDFIKRNTFSYAGKKQKELLNLILMKESDHRIVRKFLDSTKKEFYSKKFEPKELAITQRIGKNREDYKVIPLGAQLALEVEKETGEPVYKNEIEYIITGHGIRTKGVLLDKFNGEFDRDYYWTNKTLPILERMTKIAFPDVVDFFTPSRSLFS